MEQKNKKGKAKSKTKRMWSLKRKSMAEDRVNAPNTNEPPGLHQAVGDGNKVMIRLLMWRGFDINETDCFKRTALHLACQSNKSIVKLLLSYGADPNVQDNSGETPLHVACWSKNIDVISVLLENGAKSDLVNNKDMTPLQAVACLKVEDTMILDSLLDSNVPVDTANSKGWSALHYACFFQRVANVFAILIKGGNLNLQDCQGNTPLHLACTTNESDIVKMLLSKGAKVDAKNHIGRTALHMASAYLLSKIIDILVTKGADVNSQDLSGNTPLHLAVSGESQYVDQQILARTNTIEKLLMRGARVDVQNVFLKTPFDGLVCYVKQFCFRAIRTTLEIHELARLKDMVIDHIIKLKTAGLHVDIDISSEPRFSSELVNQCGLELANIKSIIVVNDLSLYHVFSHIDKFYLMSHDELLAFDEYLKSPDLAQKFPLYGHLLKSTFQRSKMATQTSHSSCEDSVDGGKSESGDTKYFGKDDQSIVDESEEENEIVQREYSDCDSDYGSRTWQSKYVTRIFIRSEEDNERMEGENCGEESSKFRERTSIRRIAIGSEEGCEREQREIFREGSSKHRSRTSISKYVTSICVGSEQEVQSVQEENDDEDSDSGCGTVFNKNITRIYVESGNENEWVQEIHHDGAVGLKGSEEKDNILNVEPDRRGFEFCNKTLPSVGDLKSSYKIQNAMMPVAYDEVYGGRTGLSNIVCEKSTGDEDKEDFELSSRNSIREYVLKIKLSEEGDDESVHREYDDSHSVFRGSTSLSQYDIDFLCKKENDKRMLEKVGEEVLSKHNGRTFSRESSLEILFGSREKVETVKEENNTEFSEFGGKPMFTKDSLMTYTVREEDYGRVQEVNNAESCKRRIRHLMYSNDLIDLTTTEEEDERLLSVVNCQCACRTKLSKDELGGEEEDKKVQGENSNTCDTFFQTHKETKADQNVPEGILIEI